MNHIDEDQLVLFYYGESAEAQLIENHLSGCESCKAWATARWLKTFAFCRRPR